MLSSIGFWFWSCLATVASLSPFGFRETQYHVCTRDASLIAFYNRGALSVFFFALGWLINIWWGMNKQASKHS